MPSACLDGAVVPLADAQISVTDEGLLRGDGVFEVMRLYGGAPFALDRHLERMARSARNLRLEIDTGQIASDVRTLLEASKPGDAQVRVVLTRAGRRIVLIEPLPEPPDALSLGCVQFSPVLVLDGVKSLSYAANMLATRLAQERGFDDALLITPEDHVLELPTSSFFWVAGGRAHTPPLSEHILDSITRRVVLERIDAVEVPTTLADLERAEEAFIASSVREVLAVSRVEQVELSLAGPVTAAAASELRAHIAAELASPQ
jgi:branched-chain amino acid aminotransferase